MGRVDPRVFFGHGQKAADTYKMPTAMNMKGDNV